jgi:hypothetical protein
MFAVADVPVNRSAFAEPTGARSELFHRKRVKALSCGAPEVRPQNSQILLSSFISTASNARAATERKKEEERSVTDSNENLVFRQGQPDLHSSILSDIKFQNS